MTATHLMMAVAEEWCIEQLAIPVTALGAAARNPRATVIVNHVHLGPAALVAANVLLDRPLERHALYPFALAAVYAVTGTGDESDRWLAGRLSCCSFVLVDQPAEDLAAPYPRRSQVGNRVGDDAVACNGACLETRNLHGATLSLMVDT